MQTYRADGFSERNGELVQPKQTSVAKKYDRVMDLMKRAGVQTRETILRRGETAESPVALAIHEFYIDDARKDPAVTDEPTAEVSSTGALIMVTLCRTENEPIDDGVLTVMGVGSNGDILDYNLAVRLDDVFNESPEQQQ